MPGGIRITFKDNFGSLVDITQHTREFLKEALETALRRSAPLIAKLWQDESRRIAPRRSGRLINNLNMVSFGGTQIRHNYIFYELFVRIDQGNRDFLLMAFNNIRKQAINIIRVNFRIAVGT